MFSHGSWNTFVDYLGTRSNTSWTILENGSWNTFEHVVVDYVITGVHEIAAACVCPLGVVTVVFDDVFVTVFLLDESFKESRLNLDAKFRVF